MMPSARPAEAQAYDGIDQQPFGYDLDSINGIGLPMFNSIRPPIPQPPGRQILNTTDNSRLDNFFRAFENPPPMMQEPYAPLSLDHFQTPDAFADMPPNFIGSESVLLGGNGHEFHDWQMDSFTYQNSIPHTDVHTNPALQHPGYSASAQPGPSTTQLAPIYSSNFQQQPFQPQGQPLQTRGRGPVPNFGSDAHFQPTGFNHVPDQPHGTTIHDDSWLASNPSTQPNTRPNTQPSSPTISRKRKSEADHSIQRNGFMPAPHHGRSSSQASIPHARLSYVKNEPIQEPTPHSSLDNQSAIDSDADAGAESDTEYPSQTATPPGQRAFSKSTEPTSAAKTKKKSNPGKSGKATSNATARPKTTQRNSSNAQSRRQPLTLDQKKANHTNSEQRRRDATARAQARLFDLVPQVRAGPGKQSTVIKLGKVVEYIKEMEQMEDALTEALYPGSSSNRRPQRFLDSTTTDDIDAAAADALAGMGSADSSIMFGDVGGMDGGTYH